MLLANAFGNFVFNTFFFMVIMICWVQWMLAVHDKGGHVKGYVRRGFFSLLKRWLK